MAQRHFAFWQWNASLNCSYVIFNPHRPSWQWKTPLSLMSSAHNAMPNNIGVITIEILNWFCLYPCWGRVCVETPIWVLGVHDKVHLIKGGTMPILNPRGNTVAVRGRAGYLPVAEDLHNTESIRIGTGVTFCSFENWIPKRVENMQSPTWQAVDVTIIPGSTIPIKHIFVT